MVIVRENYIHTVSKCDALIIQSKGLIIQCNALILDFLCRLLVAEIAIMFN